MKALNCTSIRPFIGSFDYNLSRRFYKDLGFEEVVLHRSMSLFKINASLGFYLQKAYVKDWIDNTMLFIEVENVDNSYRAIKEKNLPELYGSVRLIDIKEEEWGREFFLHDPAGILWHFGEFY
jgi:hypothetical protein